MLSRVRYLCTLILFLWLTGSISWGSESILIHCKTQTTKHKKHNISSHLPVTSFHRLSIIVIQLFPITGMTNFVLWPNLHIRSAHIKKYQNSSWKQYCSSLQRNTFCTKDVKSFSIVRNPTKNKLLEILPLASTEPTLLGEEKQTNKSSLSKTFTMMQRLLIYRTKFLKARWNKRAVHMFCLQRILILFQLNWLIFWFLRVKFLKVDTSMPQEKGQNHFPP